MAQATNAQIAQAEKIIGYQFKNKELIRRALTHPSATEYVGRSYSYERLEFLGDSILGGMVAVDLFSRFPDIDEGGLTRMKISLVSGATLSRAAQDLGIVQCIYFGSSERRRGEGRGIHSALENVYEAIVGALYLDAGFAIAHAFVVRSLAPYMSADLSQVAIDPKSQLQILTLQGFHIKPEYAIVSQDGPAHTPNFTAEVRVRDILVGTGCGNSKKHAEAAAAKAALESIGDAPIEAFLAQARTKKHEGSHEAER